MGMDQIEKTKRDYTDLYVTLVDCPAELQRFVGLTGQVKTINMNGRALVEWLDYHKNIGWYDIDLDNLKVVDKPPDPEPPAKKPAPAKQLKSTASDAKPKAEKKLSPLEILRQQSAKKQTEDS